jgi:hypothetical protein
MSLCDAAHMPAAAWNVKNSIAAPGIPQRFFEPGSSLSRVAMTQGEYHADVIRLLTFHAARGATVQSTLEACLYIAANCREI